MRVLVLGIGNTILSDDGVGVRVAREIEGRIRGVDVAESDTLGIGVLDHIRGYDKVIFIDSLIDRKVPPGAVREFSITEIEKSYPFLSHGINLPAAVELGRMCGEDVPRDIRIYGIGTQDTTTFGENCTSEVEEAIPGIVAHIVEKEFGETSK